MTSDISGKTPNITSQLNPSETHESSKSENLVQQNTAIPPTKSEPTQETTTDLPTAQQFTIVLETLVAEANQFVSQSHQSLSPPLIQELQSDLQWVRQLVKEMKELTTQRGVEIYQALNHIKVEHGGQFWQKVLQVLQKGSPGGDVAFQFPGLTTEKITEIKLQQTLIENQRGIEIGKSKPEELRRFPGPALLELIKAETNPKNDYQHYLLALQILRQEGYEKSSEHLLAYLRRRGRWSEAEFEQYFGFFLLRPASESLLETSKRRGQWLYLLLSLLVLPCASLLGFSFYEGIFGTAAVAAILSTLLFLFSRK